MIKRGFAEVNNRHVHWRAAGSGPVVVLLHESPRSSTSLLPLLSHLSQNFCCIAFDTPGYGASDPLDNGQGAIADFSSTLLAAVTRLGIQRFALYGTHTGAAIATQMALSAPESVTALVTDGLAMFTPAEQKTMLEHYLIDHDPQWDGSHLNRIWSRILDQSTFFPFYDRTESARLPVPNNDLAFMVRSCVGFLEAANHYRTGYQAAICYDANHYLNQIEVPTKLHCKTQDLLTSHLERADATNTLVCKTDEPLSAENWLGETTQWFLQHPGQNGCAGELPQHASRVFVLDDNGAVYAAKGTGSGILFVDRTGTALTNGLFGTPQNTDQAAWFVDAPSRGVNAMVNYEYKQIASKLGDEAWTVSAPSDPPRLPEVSYDGAFLTSSWFAVRDNSLGITRDRTASSALHPTVGTPALDSIVAGQLAMLYSELRHLIPI